MYNRYLKYFPSLTIPELTIVILTNENLFFSFVLLSHKRINKILFLTSYVHTYIFQIFVCTTVSIFHSAKFSALRLYRCPRASSLTLSIQFHPISHIKSVPSSPARPLTRNLEFLNKLISSLFSYIKYIRRFTPCSPVLVRNAEGTSSRRWNI